MHDQCMNPSRSRHGYYLGEVLGGPADFHYSFSLPARERAEERHGHPALDQYVYANYTQIQIIDTP
jgi:hypothetical protein